MGRFNIFWKCGLRIKLSVQNKQTGQAGIRINLTFDLPRFFRSYSTAERTENTERVRIPKILLSQRTPVKTVK